MSVRLARSSVPRFDLHRCKRCGLCAAVCPEEAIEVAPHSGAVLTRPEVCSGCLTCELICPDFAVCVAAPVDRLTGTAGDREKAGDRETKGAGA